MKRQRNLVKFMVTLSALSLASLSGVWAGPKEDLAAIGTAIDSIKSTTPNPKTALLLQLKFLASWKEANCSSPDIPSNLAACLEFDKVFKAFEDKRIDIGEPATTEWDTLVDGKKNSQWHKIADDFDIALSKHKAAAAPQPAAAPPPAAGAPAAQPSTTPIEPPKAPEPPNFQSVDLALSDIEKYFINFGVELGTISQGNRKGETQAMLVGKIPTDCAQRFKFNFVDRRDKGGSSVGWQITDDSGEGRKCIDALDGSKTPIRYSDISGLGQPTKKLIDTQRKDATIGLFARDASKDKSSASYYTFSKLPHVDFIQSFASIAEERANQEEERKKAHIAMLISQVRCNTDLNGLQSIALPALEEAERLGIFTEKQAAAERATIASRELDLLFAAIRTAEGIRLLELREKLTDWVAHHPDQEKLKLAAAFEELLAKLNQERNFSEASKTVEIARGIFPGADTNRRLDDISAGIDAEYLKVVAEQGAQGNHELEKILQKSQNDVMRNCYGTSINQGTFFTTTSRNPFRINMETCSQAMGRLQRGKSAANQAMIIDRQKAMQMQQMEMQQMQQAQAAFAQMPGGMQNWNPHMMQQQMMGGYNPMMPQYGNPFMMQQPMMGGFNPMMQQPMMMNYGGGFNPYGMAPGMMPRW